MPDRPIRLSEKHGVNPSLMQCFGCMKDYGVALLGRIRDDQEAPRRIADDRSFCNECEAHMKEGVILISVDEAKTEDKKNPWRTGGWVVVTVDYIRRVVKPEKFAESICRRRMAFVPDDAWELLGLPRGEIPQETT